MGKFNAVSCDWCNSIEQLNSEFRLPQGWITMKVQLPEGVPNGEFLFCKPKCVGAWARDRAKVEKKAVQLSHAQFCEAYCDAEEGHEQPQHDPNCQIAGVW